MLGMIHFFPKNVLDICCGTSVLFPYINEEFKNCQYNGIDLSDKMLDIGKKNFSHHKNFKVSQQDAENLAEKDQSYDLVIIRLALHHLPNPTLTLQGVKKVLNDEGVLLITEPTSNTIIKAFRRVLYKVSPHFSSSHVSYTVDELKKIIEGSGLKIKKIRRFGLIAYPFAFPDIINLFKYTPLSVIKIFIVMEKVLEKVPIIRNFCWTVIIIAEKPNTK